MTILYLNYYTFLKAYNKSHKCLKNIKNYRHPICAFYFSYVKKMASKYLKEFDSDIYYFAFDNFKVYDIGWQENYALASSYVNR